MTRSGSRDGAARRNPEAGFTLIEVMAAMVILIIAMTAVFATFTTQQKSFTVQSRVAEMQQNLRQGVEYMMRDIRMAGYGVPPLPDNVTLPAGTLPGGVTSIRGIFALDSSTGPDQIYVLYQYDMDTTQPPTRLTAPMGMSSSRPVTVDNVFGFDNSDLILVSGGTTADLFRVTGTPAGNTLPVDTAGYNADAAHFSWPAGGYLSNPPATVAKARFARYYIDSATDPAHPTLMVDRMAGNAPQPVADDIEDMQLTYGTDTDADGLVETWTPTPGTLSQVRQVRLQLLARARMPDANWSETRPALGNRAAGATADGYRRRTIDVVIDVRNSGF